MGSDGDDTMIKEALDNLIAAVENDRTDIIRTILATCQANDGVDVTASKLLNSTRNNYGTVLHLATKKGNADAVRALLSAGADPCVQNDKGETALDLKPEEKVLQAYKEELLQATAQSNVGRVCQLLAAGIDVNIEDSPTSKNTPLHWGATYGNKEIIQCLCDRGANISALNAEGCSPLHDAVLREDTDISTELLKAGADLHLSAVEGKYCNKSALDLADANVNLKNVLLQYADHNIKMPNGDISDNEKSGLLKREGSVSSVETQSAEPTSSLTPLQPSNSTSTTSEQEALPDLLTKVSDKRLHNLWPLPQSITQKDGEPFIPGEILRVHVAQTVTPGLFHSTAGLWQKMLSPLRPKLELHLETCTRSPALADVHVLCEVNRRLFTKEESYKLSVSSKIIRLHASDLTGLYYGITTLMQLLRLCGLDGVPPVQINDWPSIRDRGILLDVSGGRRARPEVLMTTVRHLSALKVNQLQLYTRFTCPEDEEETPALWQCVYAKNFLVDLDALCQEYYIPVVPVLDIAPSVTLDNLSTLQPAFQQFMSCFPSMRTVSVGPRLSSLMLDITEEGQATLDEARRTLCLPPDVTVELCAFVLHDSMNLLTDFPCNTKLSEYGFLASYDFQKQAKLYSDYGIPFVLLPGTAAWNSLGGCPEAAVRNIFHAVEAAATHNALGVTVCQWAGVGFVTHHTFTWPGLITAAGLMWNTNIPWNFMYSHLAELLNMYIFHDTSGVLGQVIVELGRADTYVLRHSRKQEGTDYNDLPADKGSTLFQFLLHPDSVPLDDLSVEVLQRAMRHIRKCQNELSKSSLLIPDGPQITTEVQLTADLMLLACRIGRALILTGRPPRDQPNYSVINPGMANLTPTVKTDLANRLLSLIEQYRDIWLARNLPQGLQESIALLSQMLKQTVPELAATIPQPTQT